MYIIFTTEGFLKVAIESWPQCDLNSRPLNSVQTLYPTELSRHEFNIAFSYHCRYFSKNCLPFKIFIYCKLNLNAKFFCSSSYLEGNFDCSLECLLKTN